MWSTICWKNNDSQGLGREFGFVRVDLDQINGERGLGGLANDDISDADWKNTYDESYKRVDQALSEGKTVINDTANFTREQRDKLRAIAKKYNIPTKVIYLSIPESVAKKRWLDNRITKIRYDVRDEDFAEVADNFQPPREDENVLIYNQSEPIEKWIAKSFG